MDMISVKRGITRYLLGHLLVLMMLDIGFIWAFKYGNISSAIYTMAGCVVGEMIVIFLFSWRLQVSMKFIEFVYFTTFLFWWSPLTGIVRAKSVLWGVIFGLCLFVLQLLVERLFPYSGQPQVR